MRGSREPGGRGGAAEGSELLVVGCVAWALLAWALALPALPKVDADARPVVGILSGLLPGLALAAGFLLWRGHGALAAIALVLTVATPTYYFYPGNLLPIALAIAIAVRSRRRRKRLRTRSGSVWSPG